MPKRPAEESLEESSATNSPASKKSRTQELGQSQLGKTVTLNGHATDRNERNGHHSSQDDEASDEAASSEVDDDESLAKPSTSRQTAPTEGYKDLYLDTIKRSVLDFDFEKLCSISLSNINVYACLVCGKYFQGRGPKSHAYFHALEVSHHVYVNMETKGVYVLPEGYEVKSQSLDDIKFQVDPHLPKGEVLRIDRTAVDARDLEGREYRPGMTDN